jgi:hypothetical protein
VQADEREAVDDRGPDDPGPAVAHRKLDDPGRCGSPECREGGGGNQAGRDGEQEESAHGGAIQGGHDALRGQGWKTLR